MGIFEKLKSILLSSGADFVEMCSIEDMNEMVDHGFISAISIGKILRADISIEASNNPSEKFYDESISIYDNLEKLNDIAVKFLVDNSVVTDCSGATEREGEKREYSVKTPHALIATKCGLGWIGKCNILVSEKYGSSLRLTTVLTNMKYQGENREITESLCGTCMKCVDICPAEAMTGENWRYGQEQEKIYDWRKCAAEAEKRREKNPNKEYVFCSKCTGVCPYTIKALNV